MSTTRIRRARLVAVTALSVIALGSPAPVAEAQWTVVNLHPPTATNSSQAYAVRQGQQVGFVQVFALSPSASLWTGTPASWINLAPPGAVRSEALDVEDGVQVGYMASADTGDRAAMWTGTAASWVNLNPEGARDSRASAISDGRQGGYVSINDQLRATLWNGTPASWVDMHPPGAMRSSISGMGDGQQVGNALFGMEDHAILWSGTPDSWTDLHPTGSTLSFAMGVSDGQQTGAAYFGSAFHAGLWRGTAASWVDLNPEGAEQSFAFASHRGRQVGYANVGGRGRASVWRGTAASWVDLTPFSPPEMVNTGAQGISSDETNTYVVGYGLNGATGGVEALMWTLPLCSPPVITVQPANQSPCPGASARFTVAAFGTAPPFTYQWRKDGVPIPVSGPGGNPSAATATLMLPSTDPDDPGLYDAVVSSSGECGSVTSLAATLMICRADINCSGRVSVQDLFDFLALYFAGDPQADFNGVNGVSVDDIFDLLTAYFAGCG